MTDNMLWFAGTVFVCIVGVIGILVFAAVFAVLGYTAIKKGHSFSGYASRKGIGVTATPATTRKEEAPS